MLNAILSFFKNLCSSKEDYTPEDSCSVGSDDEYDIINFVGNYYEK